MLLSPGYLLEAPGLILATLAVVMLGKPLIALVVVRLLGYPVQGRAGHRRCAGADRGVLVHPVEHRARSGHSAARSHEHARGGVDRRRSCSIRSCIALVPRVDKWAAAHPRLWKLLNPPLVDARRAPAQRTRPLDREPPRGRRRLRPDRPHSRPPAPRQRHRAHRDRAEHGHGAPASRSDGIDAVYGDATQRDTLEAPARRTPAR